MLFQLKMQQIGEFGSSINFLRSPKWITELKFNRKIAQTAPCINCTFCWNRTKLPNSWERHQNPWQGRTQKPAPLPSSRSLIKLAECCIQRLKVMWSPWVSHMYVLLRQRMKKKNSFCFPTSLPYTHFMHRENINDHYTSRNCKNKKNEIFQTTWTGPSSGGTTRESPLPPPTRSCTFTWVVLMSLGHGWIISLIKRRTHEPS